MAIILDHSEPAIVRGIKTVGVGKKGSKNLSKELAMEIKSDLDLGKVSDAAKGAFFAGLLAKGITETEIDLVPDASVKLEEIIADAPAFVQWVCKLLIEGKTLDVASAYDLGKFLFSKEKGDGARGLIASFLRVRYETAEEYEGIWRAMQETIEPSFQDAVPVGEPIVQIAEPFDGNDHSYLTTPIIGACVQSMGFRVIHMIGRNSGPKLVFNLRDVVENLSVTYATCNKDLGHLKPQFGWFYQQSDVSRAVDLWVDIRRQTIKRPFLATLEKFINPASSDIIVTSAFHPPYGEKMLTMSERAGFKGAMVIRNGMEGSCGMPLKRPAKILLSALQKNGQYQRHEIDFDVEAFLPKVIATEEQRLKLTANENAQFIKNYMKNGSANDVWFDARVVATQQAFRLGLAYLKENIYGLG